MEDFNKLFEEAKKANLSIEQGIEKLKQVRKQVNMQGKTQLTDEQISEMEDGYKKVMDLKKKLDGYKNNK